MIKALGIDVGESRIGLAAGDDLDYMAHPVETVSAAEQPFERIAKVIRDRGITHVVIGLPKNMDGSTGTATEKVRAFGKTLEEKTGMTPIYWDERLTSVAAQRSLHEAGRNTKQSRAVIDQVAAQLILQGWLDSQALRAGMGMMADTEDDEQRD